MTKNEIVSALKKLNEKLAAENCTADLCLVGGAVMCLVFDVRQQTKDVDAIFHPKKQVYELAKQVAEEEGLPEDWLNDSAKGYINYKIEQVEVFDLSHLKIFAASARYMLAMKCLAARMGTNDESDIEFLIGHLKVSSVDEVVAIVSQFYDITLLQPKTRFMLEEIFENL